jgi:phosphatidylglycerol:prolipoprotein diacylglycerol transferase
VIPYFEQPHLGPIHLFGVLAVTAMLVGSRILVDRAERYGVEAERANRFIGWILVAGFVGAHLVDRFVYFPRDTIQDPMSILHFWQGLSSFGGFLGGAVAGLWYFRTRVAAGEGWKLADAFCYGFPFGWIFGRLGCFAAFDHPGKPTTFFLGQRSLDGVVRHNLGLDEALYAVVIAAVFHGLGKKPRPRGFYVGLLLVMYAPFRFAIDYLRVVDVRYLQLTPGQYGCIILVALGLAILRAPMVTSRFSERARAEPRA